ncbi:MAG TPA: HDOD domain-containing protein [Lacipirellulaceae bacterium]|jgi:HD-like signal output (HDOD) protein|nr:HDOD domain-containing protein [Lacipirellulaceae bacterium]
MTDATSQVEQLASRAVSLYTRPTVAMELIRVAESPTANAEVLKECVAQDPALACKLLRVVNSSLYGLHRPVANLSQAIGLIGIKPLKLLVLGFTLPDSLFAEVAARELKWYWTNTLTRAVAARLLGEQLWRQSGDEAFIAGLLQDVGILVLLRELGESYARFLTGVIEEKCHLAVLERETLGFDHSQLTAALLAKWHLPERLVSAIDMPKRTSRLARLSPPEGDLPQILHLAEMLAQLVGQERLSVLPELLEAGKLYRGMTKSKLIALVEDLQPQVDQLGQVLALELTGERNYMQMLVDAQRHMAVLGEEIASDATGADDEIYNQLLAHTDELTEAMQWFLAGKRRPAESNPSQSRKDAIHSRQFSGRGAVGRTHSDTANHSVLLRNLTSAATRCRERRHELSLIIAECSGEALANTSQAGGSDHAQQALASACSALRNEKATIVVLPEGCVAAILTNCDRRGALAVAHDAISTFNKVANPDTDGDAQGAAMLSLGVATVSLVPKNFDALRIVESAMRCLTAVRSGGISAVKSIEV